MKVTYARYNLIGAAYSHLACGLLMAEVCFCQQLLLITK